MSPYRQPDPEDLERSRDARIARRNLVKQEQYAAFLRHAERLRNDNNQGASRVLAELIREADEELDTVKQRIGGRIYPRRRPKRNPSGGTCTLFVDECGSHSLTAAESFKVFVLSAVIVPDGQYHAVDDQWRGFKSQHLGSPETIVHEPDVRRAEGPFREPNREGKLAAMAHTIASLDFAAMSIVIHRPDYLEDFGTGPPDSSLPNALYSMALDFLVERAVMVLQSQFNGARAQVVAEARGPKEDALLQYEFARLHLDGTSYVSPAWFRQALCPGISFQGKEVNSTGLQLADLLARPVGDKVIDEESQPYLWPEFREKMCPAQETKNSVLGLKIMPWRERYTDLWKS